MLVIIKELSANWKFFKRGKSHPLLHAALCEIKSSLGVYLRNQEQQTIINKSIKVMIIKPRLQKSGSQSLKHVTNTKHIERD